MMEKSTFPLTFCSGKCFNENEITEFYFTIVSIKFAYLCVLHLLTCLFPTEY